jgi:23S rRNA (cytidine1920-2'-O)/16S rRNA (cytidine1409-2'-O)-methyltransferase
LLARSNQLLFFSSPSGLLPQAYGKVRNLPDGAEKTEKMAAWFDKDLGEWLVKLEGALRGTGLKVAGLRCLDVGQSTGGFTDCLLQHGAAKVVGVDVGHGQLHPRLAADPRVRSFEGLNARALEASILGDAMPAAGFGLATIDVSFIALDAVLPAVVALIGECGWLVALVKPQFELGPAARDRHGIVRDSRLYGPLLDRLAASCQALNCTVRETLESPLRGGDGNREFLLIAQKNSVF